MGGTKKSKEGRGTLKLCGLSFSQPSKFSFLNSFFNLLVATIVALWKAISHLPKIFELA